MSPRGNQAKNREYWTNLASIPKFNGLCLIPIWHSTSFPGSFILGKKDPGSGWSRASQKVGGDKINAGGRSKQVAILSLLNSLLKGQFKVDRPQTTVVAKNLSVLQLFISRMPKMCAILQLVSAPLNPIPIAEHFRRSHPQCEHSCEQHIYMSKENNAKQNEDVI